MEQLKKKIRIKIDAAETEILLFFIPFIFISKPGVHNATQSLTVQLEIRVYVVAANVSWRL